MKKSSRRCSIAILMMICLCIVLSIPSIPVQAADNLSENEMIYGADIGFLSQLESQGVEWVDDNGNTSRTIILIILLCTAMNNYLLPSINYTYRQKKN